MKTNSFTKTTAFRTGVAALLLALSGWLGTGCSKDAKLDRNLQKATKLFEAGDYDKARIEFLNVWRMNRTNASAIRHLGIILFDQGSPVSSIPFLTPSAELNPNDFEARTRLGTAFLAIGRQDQARAQAIAVLDRSPTNDRAIFLLADVSTTPAEMSDAERRFQQAKQSGGDRASLHLANAELMRLRGETAKSDAEIRQALAVDPKSPFAHAAMAGLYLASSNIAQAGAELKTAAELSPLRSQVRIRYAEFKAESGAVDEAKKLLEDLTTKAPDYLPAWKALARIAVTEKRYDEALSLTERVLGRDPANLDTRLLRPQIYFGLGKPKLAVKELGELDRAFTNAPQIKFELAKAHLMNTNILDCVANLRQAVRLNTNFTDAIMLLSEINLRTGEASAAATNLLRLSRSLSNAQTRTAATPAEIALRQETLARAQFMLAQAYQVLDRPADALEIYGRYTKAQPTNYLAWFFSGVVYRQQQNPREARAAFEQALKLAPGSVPAISELVDLDLQATNYAAALKLVQTQIAANPKSPDLKIIEARVFSAQGLWDQAEASLLKSAELSPDSFAPVFQLAQTYVAAKRLPQAAKKLEAALEKNPSNLQSLMLLGMVQSELGEYSKASQAYEELIKLNPQSTGALNNLAYLYSERLNQLDKAQELARKACELQASDPTCTETLGWILYRKGDYPQALSLILQSAAKLPGDPEVQYHLGMTYYMLGQAESAKAAFQSALASGGNFSGKEEVQRRLSLLSFDASKPPQQLIADLEKLLDSNPNDLLIKTRLADLYTKTGARDKATPLYEEILRLNPRSALATAALARIYASSASSRDKGLAMAKKARELAPSDPQVAHILGKLAFQAGDFPWAFSLLQESAQKLPGNAEVLYDLAWATYSLGRVPEANQAMTRAIQATPRLEQTNAAQWFVILTSAAASPATQVSAESQAKELLKHDSDNAAALMVLAGAQAQRGEFKAAAANCELVLTQFPKFAPAQKQLAILYANNLGDDAKAWDLGSKARDTLSSDAELAATLGKLAYRRRDYSYAVRLLQESVQKNSTDAESYFCLGMSQVQLKDKARAKTSLEKAISMNLKPALATEARAALKGL